jgi:hypothetical protein
MCTNYRFLFDHDAGEAVGAVPHHRSPTIIVGLATLVRPSVTVRTSSIFELERHVICKFLFTTKYQQYYLLVVVPVLGY